MQFQIKDLKKLLRSVQQNNIDEIHIQSQTFQLTINKNKAHSISNFISSNTENLKKTRNTNQESIKSSDKIQEHSVSNNTTESYSTIISPMVGTFYRSPAPNESPFVELYDIVQKKQTVCIIEAMKLMNEIEAEVNGEIVEILVQDGDVIDCGQALMRIKPINN